MNIHEHQAKEILKEFGAPVSNGTVVLSLDEIDQKISISETKIMLTMMSVFQGPFCRGWC